MRRDGDVVTVAIQDDDVAITSAPDLASQVEGIDANEAAGEPLELLEPDQTRASHS